MAGPDTAFDGSFAFGKSLVEIDQRPIIEHVVTNLATIDAAEFIFVIRKDDARRHHLDAVLKLLVPTCTIVVADSDTAGAACTALLAIDHIAVDQPLVVTNGDQFIEADLAEILRQFQEKDLDGGVIVFDAVHPRWSYVRVNQDGCVVEAAEKRPISRHATAGFYYFRTGRIFIDATEEMIKKDDSVNNNFYVCPAFNQMILHDKKIGIYSIPSGAYHSLTTPRGVDAFQESRAERSRPIRS